MCNLLPSLSAALVKLWMSTVIWTIQVLVKLISVNKGRRVTIEILFCIDLVPTQVWSINFTTWLLLGLGLNLELLALSTNVKSGPRFAEVCCTCCTLFVVEIWVLNEETISKRNVLWASVNMGEGEVKGFISTTQRVQINSGPPSYYGLYFGPLM